MTAERELNFGISPESCASDFVGFGDLVRSLITNDHIRMAVVAPISETEVQGNRYIPSSQRTSIQDAAIVRSNRRQAQFVRINHCPSAIAGARIGCTLSCQCLKYVVESV